MSLYCYQVGLIGISSDLRLELPISKKAFSDPMIRIVESFEDLEVAQPIGRYGVLSWTEDSAWMRSDHFCALAERGDRLRWFCRRPNDRQYLGQLVVQYLLPMILAQRGWVFLHASAVVRDDGAHVFVGESGAGKSTTAAAHAACGGMLLADDVLGLTIDERGVQAHGFESACALYQDSRELLDRRFPDVLLPKESRQDGKQYYHVAASASLLSVPVVRIVVLDPGEPGLISNNAASRILMLSRHLLRSTLSQKSSYSEHLRILGELVKGALTIRRTAAQELDQLTVASSFG